MIIKPEPVFHAVENVVENSAETPIILLTPQGRLFTQDVAAELAPIQAAGIDLWSV